MPESSAFTMTIDAARLRPLAGGEVRTTSASGAEKGVKPERFDLIPSAALQEVARVYGAGAAKYDDTNYLKGAEYRKMLASLHRHIASWEQGFDYDGDELPPEDREEAIADKQATGLHHLAHAVFHCLTLITYQRYELGVDDRIGRQLEAGESFEEPS
jgi:hypothetical protein